MLGIFGNLFDLNHDGKLDSLEHGLEFMVLNDISEETTDDESDTNGFDFDENF